MGVTGRAAGRRSTIRHLEGIFLTNYRHYAAPRRLAACGAAALLLLAGCSEGSGAPASSPAASPAASVASPAASAATIAPSPSASPSVSPSPSALPSPAPETAETLYRMSDKTFRFAPIGDAPDKVVLLSFDDGPKEEAMLTQMLDALDKHGAKAIFFVNGYRVEEHPELLKLIHDRGQTVGNHSWDHVVLSKKSKAEVQKQLGDVQDIVEKTIGQRPEFFRPPHGAGGEVGKQVSKEEGMLYMTWSNGSLDWDLKATKKDPQLVIEQVLSQLHPGANILMHELQWTADGLDSLLTKLEEKGYGFIDPATIERPGAPAGR
ncbi:Peptidoglycan N-acetylglucosamine deacetylase [Paenibacillus pasadenensis]|uniref:Peptidoglycan N-acetylglucosamine deacetylase n=1 Tax=Paenibacillus pasadenensis TaxID=217090 RepID=A0A2N5N5J4_9BACL|nr:Peptidoglycan N-acetylglucosamine deacetylase [Paenibacillus pasadenensis]